MRKLVTTMNLLRLALHVAVANRVTIYIARSSSPCAMTLNSIFTEYTFAYLPLSTLSESAYVIIRQHTSTYVSIRQYTSVYVSIRQHVYPHSTHSQSGPGRNWNTWTTQQLPPSTLVIDISKYQGEGGWPAVHNCSSLEHFPIYFGVYSSKKRT